MAHGPASIHLITLFTLALGVGLGAVGCGGDTFPSAGGLGDCAVALDHCGPVVDIASDCQAGDNCTVGGKAFVCAAAACEFEGDTEVTVDLTKSGILAHETNLLFSGPNGAAGPTVLSFTLDGTEGLMTDGDFITFSEHKGRPMTLLIKIGGKSGVQFPTLLKLSDEDCRETTMANTPACSDAE